VAELRGFTCDGGCGATTILQQSHHSLMQYGWWHMYLPESMSPRTLQTCSVECMVKAIQGVYDRALPAVRIEVQHGS